MKRKSYKQYATIRSTSREEFDDELNKLIKQLMYKNPNVTFTEKDDYLIAHVSYTENVDIPETLEDHYELNNIKFTCEQCPLFSYIRNKDGSIDKRRNYGNCLYAEFGRTYKQTDACEWLYKQLYNGNIRLTLEERYE